MKYMISIAILVVGCRPNGRACKTSYDCPQGDFCDRRGMCYTPLIDASTEVDAVGPADAPVDAVPIDAAPVVRNFLVGLDCDSSHCYGGYKGQKDDQGGSVNSAWLCAKLGFPRALSFTINSSNPGGRFCGWAPISMQFVCDPSCSGCNPIDSVTCSNP